MPEIPVRCIVVDDEKPSRDALVTYIHDFCADVEVAADCDSVKSAYNAILEYKPQLVFLDIEMPNGNGFELLKLFKSPSFKVIFVTAFSEYAIQAFRFSAADYLLKPVKVDELIEAVNKVKKELALHQTNQNLQILLESISRKETLPGNLVISDLKGFTVIRVHDIINCEGEGYCTHFNLTGNNKASSSKNLGHYEELLAPHPIIRVHHSFLVNLDHVKSFTRQGEILLSENQTCPLGDKYRHSFMERIGKGR